jgi:hypothetical protein
MTVTVWVLVMWVECDRCVRSPWIHEVYSTEEACAVQANRFHNFPIGMRFSSNARWRCLKSNMNGSK